MNTNQLLVVAVVLLSVGGLAIAAATVSTPSSSDPGTGPGEATGEHNEGASDAPGSSSGTDSGESRLLVVLGVIVFVVGLLTTLVMFARWLTPRRAVGFAIVIGVVAVVSLLVLGALMDTVPEMGGVQMEPKNGTDGGGGGGTGGEATSDSPRSGTEATPLLFGIVGLAMVLLAAAVYRYSGTDVDIALEEGTDETDEPSSVQAVGQAAGRAADRLEAESDLENAIYRAWREMTDALDVAQPRTTTPEEFAEIAIEAGMSDEDVRELTRVFEEVRYGNRQPTPEREQRSQEALRRIQRTYAGGNDE